ncbi:MAG: hypothetical protein PHU44_13675 [Syntrophales bacterium]|nr:hypothetical protein [Syntrophales bacterium]MDD5642404.1 hypothetical protein [Syntrophales bacterium]
MLPVEVKITGETEPFQRLFNQPRNSAKQGSVSDRLYITDVTNMTAKVDLSRLKEK